MLARLAVFFLVVPTMLNAQGGYPAVATSIAENLEDTRCVEFLSVLDWMNGEGAAADAEDPMFLGLMEIEAALAVAFLKGYAKGAGISPDSARESVELTCRSDLLKTLGEI